MTDCENVGMRDLLPDVLAGRLSDIEAARVRRHLDGCPSCTAELSLLQAVRAARPQSASMDIAKIVANLPRPSVQAPPATDRSVRSLTHLAASPKVAAGAAWHARGMWRMAATIGVIIAGGWSVVLLRTGGIAPLTAVSSDSVRLAAAAESIGASTSRIAVASDSHSNALSNAPRLGAASVADGAAVSFGDVGNYTDEELQRVLDRLERWDGATSTEGVTTAPILPIPGGGLE